MLNFKVYQILGWDDYGDAIHLESPIDVSKDILLGNDGRMYMIIDDFEFAEVKPDHFEIEFSVEYDPYYPYAHYTLNKKDEQ
jgi:hypothetical protein